jgi:hypothetical protein
MRRRSNSLIGNSEPSDDKPCWGSKVLGLFDNQFLLVTCQRRRQTAIYQRGIWQGLQTIASSAPYCRQKHGTPYIPLHGVALHGTELH